MNSLTPKKDLLHFKQQIIHVVHMVAVTDSLHTPVSTRVCFAMDWFMHSLYFEVSEVCNVLAIRFTWYLHYV
mgnify:CR=1 FL=1